MLALARSFAVHLSRQPHSLSKGGVWLLAPLLALGACAAEEGAEDTNEAVGTGSGGPSAEPTSSPTGQNPPPSPVTGTPPTPNPTNPVTAEPPVPPPTGTTPPVTPPTPVPIGQGGTGNPNPVNGQGGDGTGGMIPTGAGGADAGGAPPATGGAAEPAGGTTQGGSTAEAGAAGMGTAGQGSAGQPGVPGEFLMTSPGWDAVNNDECTTDEAATCPLYPEENVSSMIGGDNQSPELAWTGAPAGTLSYALVLQDLVNSFVHWVLYNIPGDTTGLPPGLPTTSPLTEPAGAEQGEFFGNQGYFGSGACGNTYEFRLYALGVDAIPEGETADNDAVAEWLDGSDAVLGMTFVRLRSGPPYCTP